MTCRSTKNRFLADENEGQLSSLLHSVIVLFNSLNIPPPSPNTINSVQLLSVQKLQI